MQRSCSRLRYSSFMPLTRRDFLATSALASSACMLPSRLPAQGSGAVALTVGTVLDRIKQHVGVPWRSPTVDNLLSATPETPVHAIATTMMATFEVCKRAQALGANLIISHETPFYLHQDKIDDIKDNPVLRAKQAWLAEHNVALFHFHDHLHMMKPDGVAKGMIDQLGWAAQTAGPDLKRLDFGGTALAQIAAEMATKLNAQTIRIVGDPDLAVHAAQTSWGYCGREGGIALLADPATELLICGETREWELVEYVQDAIAAGQKKSLIVVGHVLSEQGGMIWATNWLKTFVPEVPITFVPAPEPFWLPGHPPRTFRA